MSRKVWDERYANRAVIAEAAPSAADLATAVNRSDASSLVTLADAYSPFDSVGGGAFAPHVDDGFSRVVTLVYQHGASRASAQAGV